MGRSRICLALRFSFVLGALVGCSDPGAAVDAFHGDAALSDATVADAAAAVDSAGSDGASPDDGAIDGGGFSFQEPFAVGNGAPWPQPWRELGGVDTATVDNGRGRLTPIASGYSLARMGVTFARQDVEATFTLRFEDVGTQGVGFYARQNGGYLQGTMVHGGGYAVFVEGFRGSRIGVWREVDGVETEIANFTQFGAPLQSNLTYAVRFRVTQATPGATRLQARVWDAAQAEPNAWQVDAMDATVGLQQAAGGFAFDSWSTATNGKIAPGTTVDDLQVVGL